MQRRVSPRSGNVSRDSNHSPDTASRQQADDQVSEEAHQPIQPTVRITPHDHSGMFEGSMEADREEYARQDMPSAVSETFFVEEEQTEAPAASPLLPIMNTDSLKRGFIMHEILTRPVDRHR